MRGVRDMESRDSDDGMEDMTERKRTPPRRRSPSPELENYGDSPPPLPRKGTTPRPSKKARATTPDMLDEDLEILRRTKRPKTNRKPYNIGAKLTKAKKAPKARTPPPDNSENTETDSDAEDQKQGHKPRKRCKFTGPRWWKSMCPLNPAPRPRPSRAKAAARPKARKKAAPKARKKAAPKSRKKAAPKSKKKATTPVRQPVFDDDATQSDNENDPERRGKYIPAPSNSPVY